MKRVFVCTLTLLLAVSMLFISACGKDKSVDEVGKGDTTTATTSATADGGVTTTTTTATDHTTTDTTVGSANSTISTPSSTIGSSTSTTQTKPVLTTKPTQAGTTTATPKDPTAAFTARFEEWLLNLTDYRKATPKVTKVSGGTVTTYVLTGAKYTADYCVHIRSNADMSIQAVYVSVEAKSYDFMFSVISYYVYQSLGLTKMDADAFLGQFDAFPDSLKLQNTSESGYRMSCLEPDEFLTFAFFGKSALFTTVDTVRTHLQEATCDGCYADEDRAMNYLTMTDQAAAFGYDYAMLDRALVSAGNRARLADVMKRAQKGEEITIGFIGGSVTEGAFASDYQKKSYAGLTYAWWVKTFPNAKFTFVNAGYGGTSSLYGVHRLQEDLLQYDPDFVVIEFGVNDCDDPIQNEAYANLVHRVLEYEFQPAVMLLYVMSDGGSNMQVNQIPIGTHYDLPMISYRDAVWPEVKNGRYLWEKIAADWVHPNDVGHAMIAELLISYLTKTRADLSTISTDIPKLPEPYTPCVYENAICYNRHNLKPVFSNGFVEVSNKKYSWMGEKGASITLEFTGKRCFLIVPASEKDKVDVRIRMDGGASVTLEPYVFAGGAFANYLVLDEDASAKHTIEITCNSGLSYISGLFVS